MHGVGRRSKAKAADSAQVREQALCALRTVLRAVLENPRFLTPRAHRRGAAHRPLMQGDLSTTLSQTSSMKEIGAPIPLARAEFGPTVSGLVSHNLGGSQLAGPNPRHSERSVRTPEADICSARQNQAIFLTSHDAGLLEYVYATGKGQLPAILSMFFNRGRGSTALRLCQSDRFGRAREGSSTTVPDRVRDNYIPHRGDGPGTLMRACVSEPNRGCSERVSGPVPSGHARSKGGRWLSRRSSRESAPAAMPIPLRSSIKAVAPR